MKKTKKTIGAFLVLVVSMLSPGITLAATVIADYSTNPAIVVPTTVIDGGFDRRSDWGEVGGLPEFVLPLLGTGYIGIYPVLGDGDGGQEFIFPNSVSTVLSRSVNSGITIGEPIEVSFRARGTEGTVFSYSIRVQSSADPNQRTILLEGITSEWDPDGHIYFSGITEATFDADDFSIEISGSNYSETNPGLASIDNLRLTQGVPEPSSIMLTVLAFFFMVIRRKR